MPQLLTLPYAVPLSAAGLILPGAKLSFFATTTSDPQPVYQDSDLENAHMQPVEADGAGRFPAIFLDPSLPAYRILLTDAANVTLPGYPLDDVPSNQNAAQQFRLKAAAPSLTFEETDADAGNKVWRLRANAQKLLIELLSDDEGTVVTLAELTRTGTTPASLNFAGQYLRVNGVLTATQENSSATATLTGCTTSPTGPVTIRRSGTKVSLFFPNNILGTSNSTSMSLTGISNLNFSTGGVVLTRIVDNGVTKLGTALVGTSSLNFGVGAQSDPFTGSGSKGIPAGTLIIFDTDLSSIA